MSDNNCCLYVIKCKDYYKIGQTSNLKERMWSLQAHNPFKLKLIFEKAFKNRSIAKCNENQLHSFFLNKNIRGEWFKLNSKDIKIIKTFKYIVRDNSRYGIPLFWLKKYKNQV